MKANLFRLIVVSLIINVIPVLITSCAEDSWDFENNNAGTFSITNLTTGEKIEEEAVFGGNAMFSSNGIKIAKGDTIKVTFTPIPTYSKVKFEKNCKYLTKISDTLFVVPDLSREDKSHEFDGKAVTVYSDTIREHFTASYYGDINGTSHKATATRWLKINRITIYH